MTITVKVKNDGGSDYAGVQTYDLADGGVETADGPRIDLAQGEETEVTLTSSRILKVEDIGQPEAAETTEATAEAEEAVEEPQAEAA